MHWIAFATLAILAFASRAAPAHAAELHIEDVAFLLYAMEVDRSQVRLGQLATDKGQEERVRQYGRFMINDHQRANARITKIAAEYGVEPPQDVSPVAQRIEEWLRRLSRAQFDDQYIATQVIYHYSAHYLYKRENLHGRARWAWTCTAFPVPTAWCRGPACARAAIEERRKTPLDTTAQGRAVAENHADPGLHGRPAAPRTATCKRFFIGSKPAAGQ